jgi:transcriptional regulator with XRE-family HTH domain
MTLKEFRESSGITQGQLSQLTDINIPTLSNIEAGNITPTLEDLIIIEKNLRRRLDWEENLTPRQKHDIVQNLIFLSENYPLVAVLNFAQRNLKEGIKLGDPGKLISHYTSVSGASDHGEPLYPPGIQIQKKCKECED